MSTLKNRARNAVAAGLATAALTAGLGLAGAGAAEATTTIPKGEATCAVDVQGSTILSTGSGQQRASRTLFTSEKLCVGPDVAFNATHIGDPSERNTGGDMYGENLLGLTSYDPKTGATFVSLVGTIGRLPVDGGVHNSTSSEGTKAPGQLIKMSNTTTDVFGDKLVTTVQFRLQRFAKVN